MLFSYYHKPKAIAYEVTKTGLSVTLCALFTYFFITVPDTHILILFCIILFFVTLDGLKKIMTKDRELQFLEITDESLRFRRVEGGSIDSVKSSSVRVAFVSPSHIELATEGVAYTVYIDHGSSSVLELVQTLRAACPDATIRTSQFEED